MDGRACEALAGSGVVDEVDAALAGPVHARQHNLPIRFIIFASYGNDSCALIQWAHECDLTGVVVVYSDTGWAADGWEERVQEKEAWARSLGFRTERTKSIGFVDLAHEKQGFPTQRYQWCSFRLKIEPGIRWLAENDPDARAVCLVGVRQEESDKRADFPEYLINSGNHGGRVMIAPFAKFSEEARDSYLRRAGIEPLPHRSRECLCVNSNRKDMRQFTDADVARIEGIEAEVGRPMFRPHRHLGATGIREIMEWARSEPGRYKRDQPELDLTMPKTVSEVEDELPQEENLMGCDTGWCGR